MLPATINLGTRVVLLKDLAAVMSGTVTRIRSEPYLKPYLVECDDGETRYASAYELALEQDPDQMPVGAPMHDD